MPQSLHKLEPHNWIPYNLDYRGYKGRGKRFVIRLSKSTSAARRRLFLERTFQNDRNRGVVSRRKLGRGQNLSNREKVN